MLWQQGFDWLVGNRSRLARQSRRHRGSNSLATRRRALRSEPLEERRLLAITVDTLVDEADGSIVDGDVSLRDAIALAPAGETIDFAVTGTIGLTLGELLIDKDLTFDGPGAELLTIDASGNDRTPDMNRGDGSRVMRVTANRVDVRGLTLTGGDVSDRGGGIMADGAVRLSHSTISGNFAGGHIGGGGVYAYGTVTMNHSTVNGNHSSGEGGGIFAYSGATLTDSTVSDNSGGGGTGGGGIWAFEGVSLTRSTVSGNSTLGSGGGIWSVLPVSLNNSTVSGNTANGDGGGIRTYGTVSLNHSTVSDNSAANNGGGIWTGSGGTLAHSIVAGNQSANSLAPDLFVDTDTPDALTASFSLIGDNTDSGLTEAPTADAMGNLIGGPTHGLIDPLLGLLTANGGPTLTHAPLPGSPAIDAGDASFVAPPEFDQRGAPFARDSGVAIDIGAVELQTQSTVEDLLQQYVDEGVLSHGQANALSVKLRFQGNELAKPKRQRAFVHQVDAFVRADILTDEQGQALVDAVDQQHFNAMRQRGVHDAALAEADDAFVAPNVIESVPSWSNELETDAVDRVLSDNIRDRRAWKHRSV